MFVNNNAPEIIHKAIRCERSMKVCTTVLGWEKLILHIRLHAALAIIPPSNCFVIAAMFLF